MPSRFLKIVPAACVALVLLLNLVHPATAQNNATQRELSEHLAAHVRSKWEMIDLETSALTDEWAGRYGASDGPTVTTDFAWSPVSGFIVWWYNCSRPTSARANHGPAVFDNGLLKITPMVSAEVPGSFTVATEFVPVKWGAQHYLIPQDQMMKFVYAVNSRSESEIDTFLVKRDDYDKKRVGRPAVPAEYARYLGMRPIIATITALGPKTGQWYPKVTLNAGKSEGVIPEMKFYYYRRGELYFAFEVTSVDEHTAEAAVVLSTDEENGEPAKLKRGWKVSSRVRKGSERVMP